MQRRIFAIPLCIILCIAVFSSSVFALPPNDYNTTVNCTWQLVSGLAGNEFTMPSGELRSWGLWSPNSDNYVSLSSYSGVMPVSYDLYIAVLTSSLPHVYFEGLDDYYYPAGNITETVSLNPSLMYYDGTPPFKGNTPLSTTVVDSVTFCYFRDVPAGTSFQVNDLNPYPPEGTSFINAYSSYAQSNVNYSHYLFGFFFATAKVTGDQIIDQYKNGDISLSDAISSINDIVNDQLSSSSSNYSQSILNILIGQSQIDELLQLSDDIFLSKMINRFVSSLNSFIGEYFEGYLTLEDTVSEFNRVFKSYLDDCETLEQGEALFSAFELSLNQLEVSVQAITSSRIDSVVSNDVLDGFQTVVDVELYFESLFDQELFQSQTDLDSWIRALDLSESVKYKQFFDYFLNDSPLNLFVMIPMSLILFRLVLGTSLSLARNRSGS